MKRNRWTSGLVILSLAIGCDQAQKDVQQAAAKTAAEATARVKQAGEEAKAAVEDAGEKAKAEIKSAVDKAANLKIGDVDLGQELTSLMERLKETLAQVKDSETAKAALPKLEEANAGLTKFTGHVAQLPAAATAAVAKLINTHSAAITELANKISGIDGVGPILKPVLDQIVTKLATFSGARDGGESVKIPD